MHGIRLYHVPVLEIQHKSIYKSKSKSRLVLELFPHVSGVHGETGRESMRNPDATLWGACVSGSDLRFHHAGAAPRSAPLHHAATWQLLRGDGPPVHHAHGAHGGAVVTRSLVGIACRPPCHARPWPTSTGLPPFRHPRPAAAGIWARQQLVQDVLLRPSGGCLALVIQKHAAARLLDSWFSVAFRPFGPLDSWFSWSCISTSFCGTLPSSSGDRSPVAAITCRSPAPSAT